ncbi:mob kinase activator-like [Anaeramoeba flamelloides]|uniref:Mob kinase activator-like n=1 Tax=Anaeramoeba flamelloides TaxID=1746091 RepID=A0AAV7YFK4_9EUKA|nr:mob kinase activator-like [Anaeramoeba flamelloides]
MTFKKSSVFRATRSGFDEEKQRELNQYHKSTSGRRSVRKSVQLPEGEILNEWLAYNTVDFYNQTNMIFGTISDYCKNETCPMMTAGKKYEYYWSELQEGEKIYIKLTAPQYIQKLMDWTQSLLDDPKIFSSKSEIPFPKNFKEILKDIYKRLFRVYTHIFYHHYHLITTLGFAQAFNGSFKRFIFFVLEFDLIVKSEMKPLNQLIESLSSRSKKKKHDQKKK